MIYSFRPLSLMKGCRWMTYHLTVHTVIIPMSMKTNNLTTMYLTRYYITMQWQRERQTDRQTDRGTETEKERETERDRDKRERYTQRDRDRAYAEQTELGPNAMPRLKTKLQCHRKKEGA